MRCKPRLLLTFAALVSLVGATTVDAAVTVTSTVNVAPAGGAGHDPYDPATDVSGSGPVLTASSIDLAQGLTEAGGGISTTGNDNQEESFGIDATTDGSLATVYNVGGNAGDAIDHAAYASVNTNDLLTYNLGGLYNLSQVDVFSGWNDSGRDDFSFNLLVSPNGVAFSQIASYDKGGDNTGDITVPITSLHSITDDGAADIASAVQYVQLQITDADNGFAGLVEVDVFGVQVPEPSAIALLGFAFSAMVGIRRNF